MFWRRTEEARQPQEVAPASESSAPEPTQPVPAPASTPAPAPVQAEAQPVVQTEPQTAAGSFPPLASPPPAAPPPTQPPFAAAPAAAAPFAVPAAPPPPAPAAAPASPVEQMLADIYERTLPLEDGQLADYIPELTRVPPNAYGLAIATTQGKLHKIGDADAEFTIQSVSKALTYAMALELCGREAVLACVGVEPSGDPFNAIEFSPVTRRPYNPMVNAGAIAVTALLRDALGAEAAYRLILERFSQAAGRELRLNEDVYRSETLTGHRNRAIAHLLLSVGAVKEPVEPALDLYFRQCSILVSAADLAFMAATIANLGVNPVSRQQVFDIDSVRDTQSVMFSCGMYDFSGGWTYEVGIPAKSGVGGGIFGVVNRQLGIGSYSPRLDRNGNSVRGIASFKMMSNVLGLHAFDLTNTGSAFVSSFFAPGGNA